MAKDYFQDIVPSDEHRGTKAKRVRVSHKKDEDEENSALRESEQGGGIRSINIPQRRPGMNDVRPGAHHSPASRPPQQRGGRATRSWLWVLSGFSVLAVFLLLLLFVFRNTTVSITPQTQTVTFDSSSQFTAYPASTAASGTIPYTLQSTDLETSQVVSSNGSQHVDTKASGNITLVNNYSSAPLKFVKSTRFQTVGGLIFRTPADVSIPGKTASGPGKVSITVVADAAGAQYNIGPQAKLTLPGLKSTPAEYAAVYATSAASTTGGFSGDQPAISQGDLAAAQAQMHTDLQTKADAFMKAQTTETMMALAYKVSFTDEANTQEAGNTVRLHEAAHVQVAVVPQDAFASAIGQTVATDASIGSLKLLPGTGFAATVPDTSLVWGSDALTFTLTGRGLLVLIVDTKALQQALAGRNQAAFQTIVANFPGVQIASARIEPFWESTFPTNPADIHILIKEPNTAQ